MPSQRAILADITDMGLRPDKPHQVIGTNGRLRPVPAAAVIEPEPVTEPQPTVEEVPEEPKKRTKRTTTRKVPRDLSEEES